MIWYLCQIGEVLLKRGAMLSGTHPVEFDNTDLLFCKLFVSLPRSLLIHKQSLLQGLKCNIEVLLTFIDLFELL